MRPPLPVLSIRLAKLTVLPQMSNMGVFPCSTPPVMGPAAMPMRIRHRAEGRSGASSSLLIKVVPSFLSPQFSEELGLATRTFFFFFFFLSFITLRLCKQQHSGEGAALLCIPRLPGSPTGEHSSALGTRQKHTRIIGCGTPTDCNTRH